MDCLITPSLVLVNQYSEVNINMDLTVECPFCDRPLPLRIDKRGGRYFRCGHCLAACFLSGKSVIERVINGGTWSLRIKREDEEILHD
jgi:hypothetical protein